MNHLFSGKPSLSKKWLQHLRKIHTEIEKANRLLLEKMSNIMNSKSPIRSLSNKRSLNQEYRKKALEKIANDNKAFLERLRSKTPAYNSRQ